MRYPMFRNATLFGLIFSVCLLLAGIIFAMPKAALSSAALSEPSGDGFIYLPLVKKLWEQSVPEGTPLLISEVLYDPSGDEPAGEWIEIYNPGQAPVDLADIKMGDEETTGGGEGMLRFPAGASIAPQGIVVVANKASAFKAFYGFAPDYEMRASDPEVPVMDKHAAWAGGNVVLLNSSDEVVLLGSENQLLDAVSWGSSTFAFDPPAPDVPAGNSLERVPASVDTNTASDWVGQIAPNPGSINLSTPTPVPPPTATATPSPTNTATATPGPSGTPTFTTTPFASGILISEVVYDPVGLEPNREWIEIFNPGELTLNLHSFKVGDEESAGGGEGMYRFPEATLLGPEEVIVIANQATSFFGVYGVNPDFELQDSDPLVPDLIKYQIWAGGNVSLGNSGDEVLIIDGVDQLVDALSWGNSDFAFDPPAPDVPAGHSLERSPADRDTNTAADWIDQENPNPGVVILIPPTPSATPTTTELPTSTPTASTTPSLTITPSVTVSWTPTPTPTVLPTTPPPPTQSSTPTMTATDSPGRHLLISEVFYDTPGTDPQEEWIEIYNPMSSPVDLSEVKLGDEEMMGGGEGMFQFPDGASIGPGEKLVIALRASGFFGLYGFLPNYEVIDSDPTVPDLMLYSAWGSGAIALSNGGDEILLLDETDTPVDVVAYESGDYAGVVPHPGVETGHSLERWPSDLDTDDCSLDFIDQANPNPGL